MVFSNDTFFMAYKYYPDICDVTIRMVDYRDIAVYENYPGVREGNLFIQMSCPKL
jgi:hypothetical protein